MSPTRDELLGWVRRIANLTTHGRQIDLNAACIQLRNWYQQSTKENTMNDETRRGHASPNCACGTNEAGQRYVDPICRDEIRPVTVHENGCPYLGEPMDPSTCTCRGPAANVQVTVTDGVVVRPGDTLIVRRETRVSRADADQLKAHLEAKLPGVVVVVVPADSIAIFRGPQLDIPARPLVLPDDAGLCTWTVQKAGEDPQPCGLELPCPRHPSRPENPNG